MQKKFNSSPTHFFISGRYINMWWKDYDQEDKIPKPHQLGKNELAQDYVDNTPNIEPHLFIKITHKKGPHPTQATITRTK